MTLLFILGRARLSYCASLQLRQFCFSPPTLSCGTCNYGHMQL